MSTKTIEQKISEAFQVEGGDWVFTKGKIREGKMLKSAVDRIEKLKINIRKNHDVHIMQMKKHWKLQDEKNDKIAELTKEIERLENTMAHMQERASSVGAILLDFAETESK